MFLWDLIKKLAHYENAHLQVGERFSAEKTLLLEFFLISAKQTRPFQPDAALATQTLKCAGYT
jgi:hypothetical protein